MNIVLTFTNIACCTYGCGRGMVSKKQA